MWNCSNRSSTAVMLRIAAFVHLFTAYCSQVLSPTEKPSLFFGFLTPLFSYVFRSPVGVELLFLITETSSLILLGSVCLGCLHDICYSFH